MDVAVVAGGWCRRLPAALLVGRCHRRSPALALPFRLSHAELSRGINNHTLTQRGAEWEEAQKLLDAFVELLRRLLMVSFFH